MVINVHILWSKWLQLYHIILFFIWTSMDCNTSFIYGESFRNLGKKLKISKKENQILFLGKGERWYYVTIYIYIHISAYLVLLQEIVVGKVNDKETEIHSPLMLLPSPGLRFNLDVSYPRIWFCCSKMLLEKLTIKRQIHSPLMLPSPGLRFNLDLSYVKVTFVWSCYENMSENYDKTAACCEWTRCLNHVPDVVIYF